MCESMCMCVGCGVCVYVCEYVYVCGMWGVCVCVGCVCVWRGRGCMCGMCVWGLWGPGCIQPLAPSIGGEPQHFVVIQLISKTEEMDLCV